MNEPLKAELHSLFSFDIYPGASSEQNTGVKLAMARFYLNVPFEEKDIKRQDRKSTRLNSSHRV